MSLPPSIHESSTVAPSSRILQKTNCRLLLHLIELSSRHPSTLQSLFHIPSLEPRYLPQISGELNTRRTRNPLRVQFHTFLYQQVTDSLANLHDQFDTSSPALSTLQIPAKLINDSSNQRPSFQTSLGLFKSSSWSTIEGRSEQRSASNTSNVDAFNRDGGF